MMTLDDHTRRCDLCGAQFETDEQLRDHWESVHEAERVGAPERSA
jgi:hypothetical protein